jgi:hypothetical protein
MAGQRPGSGWESSGRWAPAIIISPTAAIATPEAAARDRIEPFHLSSGKSSGEFSGGLAPRGLAASAGILRESGHRAAGNPRTGRMESHRSSDGFRTASLPTEFWYDPKTSTD